ncbi:topoisomerase DNA-binding C4 zinc finger domain-containing protein [Variovorax terrae]|uniref:topoisomerase DNA-binding C4 zinc finger domain-containing protein n=1 Tax=Variovorax terrae TaxID=2923278 RepID=UPI003C6FCAB3
MLVSPVSPAELCPLCSQGFVVPKHSRYGPFYSCSAFPRCTYKRGSGQRRTRS